MDQTVTEFSVPGKTIISGKGPIGWLFRHSLRLWYYFPLAILGTAGNTLMAGIAPILLEKAVNHVSATPPDTDMLNRCRSPSGRPSRLLPTPLSLRSVVPPLRCPGYERIRRTGAELPPCCPILRGVA